MKKPSKKVKIRKTWKINPATRVQKSKKRKPRQSVKKGLKEILKGKKDEEDT